MKKIFTLVLCFCFLIFSAKVSAQTVYASIASGAWNSGTVWETFPDYATAIAATPGTGTASTSTSNPSGTHNVLIRSGHTITMGAANRGCKGIIIQSGGKLWANETTARRLQIGAGGTGFTYPLIDTVQVNGILGGASDGVFIESGANAQQIKIYGTGTIDIQRIRLVGGSGASDPTTPGLLNVDIDANINLWQSGNYALSAVYNPAVTDNYTITVNTGKTVAIKDATGAFHNNQNTTTYGKYSYVIKGILDLASTTATSTITGPAPAASKITLTVDGGTFKLGAAFKADTSNTAPTSAGIIEMSAINNGIVDASLTTSFNVGKTADGASGVKDLFFGTSSGGKIMRTVAASEVNIPIGVPGTNSPNDVFITNAGVSDIFSASIKSTFDNAVPDATKTVNRQWTIDEAVAGGSVATVKLSWTTTDQPAGFNPAAAVYIMRYNGSAWVSVPATVTGTGTNTDPYVASATGFTAFSPFAVSNTAPLPILFTNVRAYQKETGIQVEWSNATETNMDKYVVEKSKDGVSFDPIASVKPTGNRNTLSSYSYFDATPFAGNNFYRIKGLEVDGTTKYTGVIKVAIGKSDKWDVAPNPIKGGIINLQVGQLEKGSYALRVFNNMGQQLFAQTVNHQGGSANYQLQLPASVTKGVYNLQMTGGSNVINKKIVVE